MLSEKTSSEHLSEHLSKYLKERKVQKSEKKSVDPVIAQIKITKNFLLRKYRMVLKESVFDRHINGVNSKIGLIKALQQSITIITLNIELLKNRTYIFYQSPHINNDENNVKRQVIFDNIKKRS